MQYVKHSRRMGNLKDTFSRNEKYVKKLAFLLKNRLFRRKALHRYQLLERQQFLSCEEIDRLNQEKRIEILRFAYRHTLFYREKWKKANISYDNLGRPKEFKKIPIVTKNDIERHFNEFVSDNATNRNTRIASTGGSTGTPLSVLHDRRPPLETASWRMLRWWDVYPADDMAFIYRLKRRFPYNVLNELIWWPTRRITLDASNMTIDAMREFSERYESLRPALIQGYVGAIHEYALFLLDNNIKPTAPKAIWVTSAPLSESQRTVIQKVFGAPVYDQYGTCEVMWLAAECKEQQGLHMNMDLRHIEFVDERGYPVPDGEWGRILITDFENRAFPLIRYEIGDVGRRLEHNCPCGVNLPLMDNVRGRKTDVIRLTKGENIAGEYLTTIFDEYPEAVRAFQVHQRADYSIVLRCAPGESPNANSIINRTLEKLRARTNGVVPVTLELVDNIPHDRGKTRFVISDVAR